MRPVLRRLIAVAAAVVPTIATVLFVMPAPAAVAAAETTTYELHDKDFGTVCRSDTSTVDLRVQYSSYTTNSVMSIGFGQSVEAIWVRAYDAQNTKLVVSERIWGTSDGSYGVVLPWDYTNLLTPKDGIPATGDWQRIGSARSVGPSSESRLGTSVWATFDDSMSLTFWLNNTIANCTVDITSSYHTSWDCGNGLVIHESELPVVLDAVAVVGSLPPAGRAALEKAPCAFPYFIGVPRHDPPTPGEVLVAGPGAPPGANPVPPVDGTGCPRYNREVKLVLGEGFRERMDQTRVERWINRIIRYFTDRSETTGRLAEGDVLLSLKLGLNACADGNTVTGVFPSPGGSPGYEAIATAKGQLFGFQPPDGPLAQSHNYVDPATRRTFQSRARVAFTYTAPAGLELPVEFRSNTFEIRITVYNNGRWDYATSGGGTFP